MEEVQDRVLLVLGVARRRVDPRLALHADRRRVVLDRLQLAAVDAVAAWCRSPWAARGTSPPGRPSSRRPALPGPAPSGSPAPSGPTTSIESSHTSRGHTYRAYSRATGPLSVADPTACFGGGRGGSRFGESSPETWHPPESNATLSPSIGPMSSKCFRRRTGIPSKFCLLNRFSIFPTLN